MLQKLVSRNVIGQSTSTRTFTFAIAARILNVPNTISFNAQSIGTNATSYSGRFKSTKILQLGDLMAALLTMIVCTQPRRLAKVPTKRSTQ